MSPTPQRRYGPTAFTAHLFLLIVAGKWQPFAGMISCFLLLGVVDFLRLHYTTSHISLYFAAGVMSVWIVGVVYVREA
jgi:hypothetical protein